MGDGVWGYIYYFINILFINGLTSYKLQITKKVTR